jgi:hypothetical protein
VSAAALRVDEEERTNTGLTDTERAAFTAACPVAACKAKPGQPCSTRSRTNLHGERRDIGEQLARVAAFEQRRRR